MTGSDDAAHRSYTEGVTNGGALLAVTVADKDAERTADLLHKHGATEIEGGYGSEEYGSANYERGAGAEDVAVLKGKQRRLCGGRADDPGGRRGAAGWQTHGAARRCGAIYSRVVSEPVSESVNLHDERVVVDRHPVDRAATDADFATGTGAVEVRAMGEEAVVGKRSRVVEEIMVGKEASDRTEQINDSVRHTEVDVEETEGEVAGAARGSKTGNLGSDRR